MWGYGEETGRIRMLGIPRHSGDKDIEMGFKEMVRGCGLDSSG